MCDGKVKYGTSFEAMLGLFRIQGQRNLEALDSYERRSYPCGECGYFHLTSKENWIDG